MSHDYACLVVCKACKQSVLSDSELGPGRWVPINQPPNSVTHGREYDLVSRALEETQRTDHPVLSWGSPEAEIKSLS